MPPRAGATRTLRSNEVIAAESLTLAQQHITVSHMGNLLRGSVLLREYLNSNHIPAKSLAAKSGIDAGRIGRLLRDTSPRVSVTMAMAIERATDGAVPVTSWGEVPT